MFLLRLEFRILNFLCKVYYYWLLSQKDNTKFKTPEDVILCCRCDSRCEGKESEGKELGTRSVREKLPHPKTIGFP